MLKIEKLTKYYGKTKGIKDIFLEVNEGEIFGFIGPNGAGKSTTIRCIMNLINKNTGLIKIGNNVVNTDVNFNYIKEYVGYLPSEIHLYGNLTVKETLAYSASFYKKDCTKKMNYLIELLNLELNKKIEELSMGNLKKVGLTIALMHDPKFIILDEPTNGLDPLMQEVFFELILNESKQGKTIFFSTHILSELKRVCKRVGIIREGSLVKIEKIDNIGNDFLIITITSKEIKKIKSDFKLDIIFETDNTIKFINKRNINILLKEINKYEIDKLLIEEPSINEVFMKFYK